MVGKTATPQNITMDNNGAIIPSTIADRIINQVKEICPIFAGVTMFHVKGTLKIPVYGDKTGADDAAHNINVAFADEFTELTADAARHSLTSPGTCRCAGADWHVINNAHRREPHRQRNCRIAGSEDKFSTAGARTSAPLATKYSRCRLHTEIAPTSLSVSGSGPAYQNNACGTVAPAHYGCQEAEICRWLLQFPAGRCLPAVCLESLYLSDNTRKRCKGGTLRRLRGFACNMRGT